MTLDRGRARELAAATPSAPVLSVYCRTDPRDPANTTDTPSWLTTLRNDLRGLVTEAEANGDGHAELQTLRRLEREVPGRLIETGAAARGRGLVWFLSPEGEIDEMGAFMLPVREGSATWSRVPRLGPLIDLLDRGEAIGLVLAGAETVRLMEWCDGTVSEPDDSLYDLELSGEWRPYRGYTRANPTRARQSVNQTDLYEKRMDDWRSRFFKDAAGAVAKRLPELGWRQVIVMADPSVESALLEAMPAELREVVVASRPVNVHDMSPPEVATLATPVVEEVRRDAAGATIGTILDAARSGGRGTLGADETFTALSERRVQHLVIECHGRVDGLEDLSGPAAEAVETMTADGIGPAEAAVRLALSGDASVTQLDADEWPELSRAGGIMSLLRF